MSDRDDSWNKQQYESALKCAEYEGPAWEDLTEEQRKNIRAINNQHATFMDDLGKAISAGGPLPDINSIMKED